MFRNLFSSMHRCVCALQKRRVFLLSLFLCVVLLSEQKRRRRREERSKDDRKKRERLREFERRRARGVLCSHNHHVGGVRERESAE